MPNLKRSQSDDDVLSIVNISRSQARKEFKLGFFYSKTELRAAVSREYKQTCKNALYVDMDSLRTDTQKLLLAQYKALTINPILYFAMQHPYLTAGIVGLAVAMAVIAATFFSGGVAGAFIAAGAAIGIPALAAGPTAFGVAGLLAAAAGLFGAKLGAKGFNKAINDSNKNGGQDKLYEDMMTPNPHFYA